jgi:hypothetical protein
MTLKLLSSEMDQAEILGSFDRYLLKREAPRFLENMPFPNSQICSDLRASTGGGGTCLLLKNCNYCWVYKNWGPCSVIEKGAMIFIAAIPIGFQIANQETRRRSKILKGSQSLGGRNFMKISVPLPLMSSLLARSVSLDSTFKGRPAVTVTLMVYA